MSGPSPEIIAREAGRRRTFAIISHPDAGKTTLTEKLLLYSGMVRTAGMVKKGKNGRLATSDWMAMEQERGISVTASAMQFPYKGRIINVLDTPGHQDFSEDTYRTLTAADAAVMVLDAAKGVETQTRKLFAACRIRATPVLTFVNKCDLYGREPLDLLAEVEEVLGIQASAINWPITVGPDFRGVIDRPSGDLILFERASAGGAKPADLRRLPFDSAEARTELGAETYERLRGELELLEVAGNAFSTEAFQRGEVTPVFFGSAFTNFGVEPFYDAFVDLAPAPSARPVQRLSDGAALRMDPATAPFSAYIFKIQANMDPRHRDALAFVRVCSGVLTRDTVVKHISRGEVQRELRLSRPATLVARERSTLDEAWPGDVVGLVNAGFAIGDTILDASVAQPEVIEHPPLPAFSPEAFARVRCEDTTRRKAFDKGLIQLTAEGTVQMLRPWDSPQSEPIVAAVGNLQFDVLVHRLRDEYNVAVIMEPLAFSTSSWLQGEVASFRPTPRCLLCADARGAPVVLFPSDWDRDYCARENPEHHFAAHA